LASQKAVTATISLADLQHLDRADLTSLVTKVKGTVCTPKAAKVLADKRITELSLADVGVVMELMQKRAEGSLLSSSDFIDKTLVQGGRVIWKMKEEVMPSGAKQEFLVAEANLPNKPPCYYYNAPMMSEARPRVQQQMMGTFICCVYSIKSGDWVMLLQESELKLKNFISVRRDGMSAFTSVLASWFPPRPGVTLTGAAFNSWFMSQIQMLEDVDFYELCSHFVVKVINAGDLNIRGEYVAPVFPVPVTPYAAPPIIPAMAATTAWKEKHSDDVLAYDPLRTWIRPLTGMHNITPVDDIDTGVAFQSYVSGSRFRGGQKSGIHYFLNTVGTCGVPTRRQNRLQVALSLILAIDDGVKVDLRGLKPDDIRSIEAARIFFKKTKSDVVYVVDQSTLLDRTVADGKKTLDTRPGRAYTIFFKKTLMEQAVKVKDDGQTSYATLLTKQVDLNMDSEFQMYDGQWMLVGCSLLSSTSSLNAFKIRLPYDGFGVFSNMKEVYRVGSTDGLFLDACTPLPRYTSKEWSKLVVTANNSANAFFLSPKAGTEVRYANLMVPVKQVILYNLGEAMYSSEMAAAFVGDLELKKAPPYLGQSTSQSNSSRRQENVSNTLSYAYTVPADSPSLSVPPRPGPSPDGPRPPIQHAPPDNPAYVAPALGDVVDLLG